MDKKGRGIGNSKRDGFLHIAFVMGRTSDFVAGSNVFKENLFGK